MSTSTLRIPAELEAIPKAPRADVVEPPASGFLHGGRLNMGPAILLAAALSAGCWFVIVKIVVRLFH